MYVHTHHRVSGQTGIPERLSFVLFISDPPHMFWSVRPGLC